MTSPLPPLPLIDDHLFIDATSLKHYTTCRRSFQYFFLQKRQSNERRPALETGQILHTLMEYRRKKEVSQALSEIEKDQERLCHLLYAGWSAAGVSDTLPIVYTLHPELKKVNEDVFLEALKALYPGFTPPLDDFRTESFMIDVLRAYNRRYTTEPFSFVIDDHGNPVVEYSFAFPLTTIHAPEIQDRPITINWMGKLDLPTLWDNGVWNLDYKTSSRDDGFTQYENDQAQIGYLWALRRYLGRTPKGFCIDGIYWRKETKTGKGLEFKRHKQPIEPERIDEWEENTIRICEDVLHDYIRGYFPMESDWCYGRWGTCQYLQVCKLEPKARNFLLQSSFYKDVTWSPLRKNYG